MSNVDFSPDFDDDDEEDGSPSTVIVDSTDRSIEKHFETGRLRVVQERNELFLPHVVDFIERDRWANLRPEYQRRLRWDDTKKSRLIESFIMNVPVPPVFLYEGSLGSYEVMDGQQRLNAIVDFMQGRYVLTGLKIWASLNGRSFPRLPPMVRRGLERSKISTITLMSDTSRSADDHVDLRAQVFERLNTGGERLNPQELRNALYAGSFNKLLIELASEPSFTDAWGIPNHEDHVLSDGTPDNTLQENALFKKMIDVEIVLRFFAFLDSGSISGSVRGMLDNTMRSYRVISQSELVAFRQNFMDALDLSRKVFGKNVFRLPPVNSMRGRLSRPLYDAEMISFHRLREKREMILESAQSVSESILALAAPSSKNYELLVGRGNTAALIKERIDLVSGAVEKALHGQP